MKFYIAGPMTGIEGYNYPAFAEAAADLRAKGFDVVCPIDLDFGDGGVAGSIPYSEYLKGCLKALIDCDAIVMLPGWQVSKGAQTEFMVALALGMKIFVRRPDHTLAKMV